MDFSIKVLGTASAMPISDRNPSAQVLSVHGRLFLIDCAEGTQKQFRKAHLSFIKLEAVFITHIHGDHVFGIFGLLSTMAMYGRTQELHIYAPSSFGGVLNFFKSYFGEGVNFEIIHHPLKMNSPELVHTSKHITVTAFPLRHKIDCYGFRFDEIPTPRKLGRPDWKPFSYAYCSDTMPFPELSEWVRGVRLLYHESTYLEEFADKAAQRFHSTAAQAARCALDAGAEKLILGHYSSRIHDLSLFFKEASAIFPNTVTADDGDTFS